MKIISLSYRMFTISYEIRPEYLFGCEMCFGLCRQVYRINNSKRITISTMCDRCFENSEYKKFQSDMVINRNFLIISKFNMIFSNCLVCSNYFHCFGVYFDYDGSYKYLCEKHFKNDIGKFIDAIHEPLRTRELIEFLHEKYGTIHHHYFSLVNFAERYKIADERAIIRKNIHLPKDLRDIVLSYYWIFERR